MFALMAVRYLFKVDIPAAAFLLVAMIPIFLGSTSEQLAFVASCIPISIAFQYKYALLMLSVAILMKNKWRLKDGRVLIIVAIMMIWELWHAFYGYFSYVEYLRDFAELILLGVVMSMDMENLDHKLVIRSLSISVVGVCMIMLIMQMQQFGFDLIAVFARSAASFRFGQSNMDSGRFAINFNANNLGFICNLATCGVLLLVTRREHTVWDLLMAVCSVIFAVMTMSRAAIVCLLMLFMVFLFSTEGRFHKRVLRSAGGIILVFLAVLMIQLFIPSILENLMERFQRKDVWNGRGSLMKNYWKYLMSSPMYLFFGVGMQGIFEKVSPYVPVIDVPHLGFQEVWVAWGVVGVVLMLMLLWSIVRKSGKYAGTKRAFYQFMPFALVIVFTMSGQLLTSSRALMAFTFSYVCMCIGRNKLHTVPHKNKCEEGYSEGKVYQ